MNTLMSSKDEMIRALQGMQVRMHSYTWSPPTDVYETEESLVVRVEVAGMRESDFTVDVDNDTLLISGTRMDLRESRAYHQMEIRYGEFSSSVTLLPNLDIERTDAEYRDGFLTIVLPKQKPAVIKIQG